MTQRLGLWQRMWRSAYSAHAYREVATDRVGSLIGYLAVLIGIATVFMTITTHLRTNRMLDELTPWLKESVPELRITDGTLSSPVTQPYVWEHEDFGFVLDTTGATTELDPIYERGVLLTSTELLYRQSVGQTRRYDLSDVPDLVLNDATWDRWLASVRSWLWIVVGVATLLWLWLAKLIQALLWALIGLLAASLTKRPLRYGALFNLAIYAMSVPLAFDVLSRVLGWYGGGAVLVSLALYAGYVGWGIFVQPMAASRSHA